MGGGCFLSLASPAPHPLQSPCLGIPIGMDLNGRGLRFRLRGLRDSVIQGLCPLGREQGGEDPPLLRRRC